MSARCVGQEPVHRERERSPPRRHWGEQQGGRRKGAVPDEEEPFARRPPTLDLRQLQEAELGFLFRAQAASIQDVVTNLLKKHSVKLVHDLVVPSMDDYILKATALADNLGLESEPLLAPVAVVGDEALRSPLHLKANVYEPPTDIPVKVAFERLNADLQISPTIEQVEMELDKLALVARELPAGELPLVHSPVASAS